MKKLVYISFIFAFVLAFASCQKEEIVPVFDQNGEAVTNIQDDFNNNEDGPQYRGGQGGGNNSTDYSGNDGANGGDCDAHNSDDNIVDPDEDEDFDTGENGGIVDPDEDEDFNKEDKGK